MKNRAIAMACAALLSLGMVACEGDTATDDGTTTDPAAGVEGGGTVDDPAMEDPALDDGTGTDDALDDGTADG